MISPLRAQGPGSGAMFDRIAGRYDLLNRLMSFGLDRGWRRAAARAVAPAPGDRVLDVATGTADLALEVLRFEPAARVVAIDPSPGMLARGARKVRAAGLEEHLELRDGDAEELPFADDSFDGASIAWGIRNVPDRPAALRELARVVRPGGRVVVLESNEPRAGLLAPAARFYLHHVVPRLGAILSGAREYRYLQTSIEAFPPPEAFAAQMEAAGLKVLEVRLLSFGVTGLFVARAAEETDR